MSNSVRVMCCAREMARIAVEHAAGGLELHSCAACGRHSWRSCGRPVDRAQVLTALQVRRPGPAPAAGRRAATPRNKRQAAAPDDGAPRTELAALLTSFTPHGSTS